MGLEGGKQHSRKKVKRRGASTKLEKPLYDEEKLSQRVGRTFKQRDV